ncbi:MAG: repressor LexA [Deltaproteobacteria bacterium]|nr:repressor LexA [Deltaproteobacteria bacterium]MBW1736042.1 repressor LexA [Deltaproteobacteria bacterium]MBW2032541.1 repressor LexA [Deltaproteobacteria bacterium]MBW2113676.1 repressor LexA [Deltaproteobacteria bacterium]MBW2357209.1 repressor LexA [Deltaproteobacteria bacterium]
MYSYNDLTQRQRNILDFIREIRRQEGGSPTYREIADHFGFKGPKAAVDHVRALEKKGFLRCHGRRSRGIELLVSEGNSSTISIPILGDIPAGRPNEQIEHEHGKINVDPSILGISADHQLFALAVNGESMGGRAIHDGDWVIADADMQPREGDIVVALIDRESTLKTLAKKKGNYYLKSENPIHQDWLPLDEMIVQGVLRAVLRRL